MQEPRQQVWISYILTWCNQDKQVKLCNNTNADFTMPYIQNFQVVFSKCLFHTASALSCQQFQHQFVNHMWVKNLTPAICTSHRFLGAHIHNHPRMCSIICTAQYANNSSLCNFIMQFIIFSQYSLVIFIIFNLWQLHSEQIPSSEILSTVVPMIQFFLHYLLISAFITNWCM